MKHHILLELFSPSWFKYKDIPYDNISYGCEGGVNKIFYSTFLIYVNEIGHYGFVFPLPILVGIVINFVMSLSKKIFRITILSKIFLSLLLIITLLQEIFRLPGGAGILLSYADYKVLREFSNKTNLHNTLLLNPWHGSEYYEGNWAGPVSERKTIFFRYDPLFISWQHPITIEFEKLKGIYKMLSPENAVKCLKQYGITHVFLPERIPETLKSKYDKIFSERIEVRDMKGGNKRSVIYIVK